MKRLILIVMAWVLATSAFSKDIKGRVLDTDGMPLEFVNVVLFQDSVFVDGVVTDIDGKFTLSSNVTDDLKIRLSYVGFDLKYLDVAPDGELGDIQMTASGSTMLKDVVVKGHTTYLKGNSLVTNVENSVLANAGTAQDVLRQIPMVVDNNGHLEIFGKGTPTVYVNGRKITDMQELSTLLSSNIRNVEVISNPGSSYAADTKAVIRIRTKKPQGDGWSGAFRSTDGFQHYFQSANLMSLKYRTGGFEIFSDFTYNTGKSREKKSTDMTTLTKSEWNQQLSTANTKDYDGFSGKLGFSWIISNKHSIGAFYQNELAENEDKSLLESDVFENGVFYDSWRTVVDNQSKNTPRHAANAYYNGQVGQLNIDFNADYVWNKGVQHSANEETSLLQENRYVTTYSRHQSSMVAEKLVLSYPVGKGVLRLGEEYTRSNTENLFLTEYDGLDNASSSVRESNMACFVEIMQRFGKFNIGAGLRYERVNYDYLEPTHSGNNLNRTYDNVFPSFNAATSLGNVQMSLSYSNRVERPGYSALNANVSYLNRMTYESGNPRLQPTRLHNLEYRMVWKNYFAQVAYTCFDNPIVNTTKPYSDDGEITILTYENFDKRHFLQAFMGGQFKVGIWQPRINVGMFTQWFDIEVNGSVRSMNKPIGIVQWQNAIHLPLDIWLNVDGQFTTAGNDRNIYATGSSCVNAKLYKEFCKKRLSLTLEARDIFNDSRQRLTLYNNAVTLHQRNYSDMRHFMFTLQYSFNVTNNRYRGTGAGNMEKKRL